MTDQYTASEIPLPASVDGERTILGAVLLDNNAFETAAFLDFYGTIKIS